MLSAFTPLPGVPLQRAIDTLRHEGMNLQNLSGGSADERLNAYHSWAPQAAESLERVFPPEQAESLIVTRRHDHLLGRATAYNTALVNHTISAEQAERVRAFTEVIQGLQVLERHCAEMPRTVLVPDTNIYLHNNKYFDELDWQDLLGQSEPIRLLVPLAVVRELDRNKRAPGNKFVSSSNPQPVRDRARGTAKRLRELFADHTAVQELRNGVSAELLLDPLGHIPVDDGDSEIIDRSLAAKTTSGRTVTIVTADGGMQFSARVAGLDVLAIEG